MQATDVLIVGCGDLGLEVARLLLQAELSVCGLRRQTFNDVNFLMIAGDVTRPETLKTLSEVNPKFLVYCVSANEQTDENYRQVYVQGLKNALEALANASQLQHVFFVSSTRMYGQQSFDLLGESDIAQPLDFGGIRLLEAERVLHQASSNSKQWKGTALRLTGIYGPGRYRMIRMALNSAQWPKHNAWTNRIYRDDAAAFIVFLIECILSKKSIDDCYIVTDSHPVSMFEVLTWLAQQLGIHVNCGSLPEVGKRMSNERMLATGFQLKHPDYRSGYRTLITEFANCSQEGI